MKIDASSDFGWMQLNPQGLDAAQLVEELKREAGRNHALFDIPIRAIKRCGDDVLFELVTQSQVSTFDNAKYAEVHLTWCNNGTENAPWPTTNFYTSLGEWNSKFDQSLSEVNFDTEHPASRFMGMTKVLWILLFVLLAVLTIAQQL